MCRANLLVQFATDHESENLALARRKRRDQSFEGIELVLALLLRRMASQRAMDCFQQRFAGYGFDKVAFAPCLYRAHAGGNISMTRHEDDRPAALQLREFFLEQQTAQGRHPNVEQDTTWTSILDVAQKTGGRLIGCNLIAGGVQQPRNRSPKRSVVVHDMNHRGAVHAHVRVRWGSRPDAAKAFRSAILQRWRLRVSHVCDNGQMRVVPPDMASNIPKEARRFGVAATQ